MLDTTPCWPTSKVTASDPGLTCKSENTNHSFIVACARPLALILRIFTVTVSVPSLAAIPAVAAVGGSSSETPPISVGGITAAVDADAAAPVFSFSLVLVPATLLFAAETVAVVAGLLFLVKAPRRRFVATASIVVGGGAAAAGAATAAAEVVFDNGGDDGDA